MHVKKGDTYFISGAQFLRLLRHIGSIFPLVEAKNATEFRIRVSPALVAELNHSLQRDGQVGPRVRASQGIGFRGSEGPRGTSLSAGGRVVKSGRTHARARAVSGGPGGSNFL